MTEEILFFRKRVHGWGKPRIIALKPEMVGKRFLGWEITSPKITRKKGIVYLQCLCTTCGDEKLVNYKNIQLRKSSMCQKCSLKITRERLKNT